MKAGTKFQIELIEDSRFVKNMSLEVSISARLSSLRTAIYGEGIHIWEIGDIREVQFPIEKHEEKETAQLRQNIVLIIEKPKTKNEIYKVINEVSPQPIKFLN